MKSNSSWLLLLAIILPGFSHAQTLFGEWSGFIKVVETVETPTLKSTRTGIINIRDNVATGSVTEQGEMTINGRLYCKGECSGSGVAELHEVIIEKDEGRYRIHGITPKYNCTSEGPNCDALTNVKHEFDIIVTDKPLGRDPNVLAGTDSTEAEIPGGGKAKAVYTWTLRRKLEIELIVTPKNYDTWLPEPGQNDSAYGKVMDINVQLRGINGKPLTQKANSFHFKLTGTSREPGISLNMPLHSPETKPDLRFLWQPNQDTTAEAQKLDVRCMDPCTSANIKLGSYDGGGWTTLTVIAKLEDGFTEIKGQLLVSGGDEEVLIPKRDPTSHIAKSWLDDNNNPGEMDDKEESPDNTNNGDGLTAYEEYRGVISEGRYRRLRADVKELGVVMRRGEIPLFAQGIGWFEGASSIKVIKFLGSEIDTIKRKLNNHFKTSHNYQQYALFLLNEKLNVPGVAGTSFHSGGPGGPNTDGPRTTHRTVVDWTEIHRIHTELVSGNRNIQMPFTATDLRARTTAHEISHGIGVEHHGEQSNERDPQFPTSASNPPYRIFDTRGINITSRTVVLGNIGAAGNQQSGDLDCLIAYNPFCQWAFTVGADGANIFNEVPFTPVGRKLCKSKLGTRYNNSIIYFGDASRGICIGQINLKQ